MVTAHDFMEGAHGEGTPNVNGGVLAPELTCADYIFGGVHRDGGDLIPMETIGLLLPAVGTLLDGEPARVIQEVSSAAFMHFIQVEQCPLREAELFFDLVLASLANSVVLHFPQFDRLAWTLVLMEVEQALATLLRLEPEQVFEVDADSSRAVPFLVAQGFVEVGVVGLHYPVDEFAEVFVLVGILRDHLDLVVLELERDGLQAGQTADLFFVGMRVGFLLFGRFF